MEWLVFDSSWFVAAGEFGGRRVGDLLLPAPALTSLKKTEAN